MQTETEEIKGTEITEAEKEVPSGRGKNFGWLLTVVISLLIAAASIFVYDRFFVQRIVAVDIKGYIAEQRDLYVAGKINEEQLRQNIDRLEKIVSQIPKNRVAIMGDAVIRNAEVIAP